MVSMNAKDKDYDYDKDKDKVKDKVKDKDKRVVSLPEPSAIPEFLVCLAGVGFAVSRLQKKPI